MKRCRFVEVKNGLSLSQIVAFFPSGSVGCRCSGTRLSLLFLQFWSNVACHQEPLQGLKDQIYRELVYGDDAFVLDEVTVELEKFA